MSLSYGWGRGGWTFGNKKARWGSGLGEDSVEEFGGERRSLLTDHPGMADLHRMQVRMHV
ncbi:MAG: hypothetical protein K2W93_05740 [Burkholderiaceae bacterium]|nr:hypothetical protein [Burkholderiaceae bacterium]